MGYACAYELDWEMEKAQSTKHKAQAHTPIPGIPQSALRIKVHKNYKHKYKHRNHNHRNHNQLTNNQQPKAADQWKRQWR
jgi:hypothetical protein